MRDRELPSVAIFAAGLALSATCSAAFGQQATAAKPSRATPLMALLDRFTACIVPALAATETEVEPFKWDKSVTPGLPGNGMAQHPMLYVGEGYNKILLVNNGKSFGLIPQARVGNTTMCGCSPMATSFSPARHISLR